MTMEHPSTRSPAGFDEAVELREALTNKERELEMAAQIGLSLAEQNHALQTRLDQTSQFEQELVDRLSKAEHDRRSFLDKSYQIDDVTIRLQLLEDSLQSQGSLNHNFERIIRDLRDENKTLREEMRSLSTHFTEIQESHGKTTHSSLKALQKLHLVEETLERERVNIADTRTQLGHLHDKSSNQGNIFSHTIRSLQESLNMARTNLDILRDEVIELQQSRADIDSALQEDVVNYRHLLDEAQATIEGLLELHAMRSNSSDTSFLPPLSLINGPPVEVPETGSSNFPLLSGLRSITASRTDSLGSQSPQVGLNMLLQETRLTTPPPEPLNKILTSPQSTPSPSGLPSCPGSPTQTMPAPFRPFFRPPHSVGLRVLSYLSQNHPRGQVSKPPLPESQNLNQELDGSGFL
ncbi:hypothetical protein H4R33_000753 [Dimargaris cristalligena]|uniref:Uncharacterized protein n=1 Tax=Dimargaris cristalligena TaxID=215637 RepID=A0A4P9ZY14_9FUNG|nr:hypothetical protein H4R33_000753 [Dimargaris cristalligena]RKP38563.1 hypothetical protein BJ085DRAFT_27561 [Dimargaris cristalligena]|eukprot:RKP38563.1 hypothetical protein BJ085DRAFT_27561 [Dimargaris cristalligena]